MGRSDLAQSDYFESNDRFADVINGVFFDGEPIICAKDLQEADSAVTTLVQDGMGQKVILDKVKKWNGLHFAIFALESQSYVDYRMVLRTMKSEAMGYDKQWRARMSSNKE